MEKEEIEFGLDGEWFDEKTGELVFKDGETQKDISLERNFTIISPERKKKGLLPNKILFDVEKVKENIIKREIEN